MPRYLVTFKDGGHARVTKPNVREVEDWIDKTFGVESEERIDVAPPLDENDPWGENS